MVGTHPISAETPAGTSESAQGLLQVAQATTAAKTLGQPVGEVKSLTGTVTVIRVDGSKGTLSTGDRVYEGDKIETAKNGKVGIVFSDGSTFSVGNDGAFTIDELIYNPTANTGKSVIGITAGLFSYVSGEIAKSGDDQATVATPVATIGIRGTTVVGRAAPEGEQNTITLLRDADGTLGQIAIVNIGGQRILTSPYELYTLFSRSAVPNESKVINQTEFDRIFGNDVVIIPSQPPQNFGPENPNNPLTEDTNFQVIEVTEISLDGTVRDTDALRRLAARFRQADELEDDEIASVEPQGEPEPDPEPFEPDPGPDPFEGANAPNASAGNVSGPYTGPISLSISAGLTDPSETLAVQITGVPSGASLTGTAIDIGAPATVNEGSGTWTVTNTELSTLSFTPPSGTSANYNMILVATSTEGSETATTSVNFTASVGPNLIIGTVNADSLNGMSLDEVIFGDAENDIINGGDGNDDIEGFSGNDTLSGDDGNDVVRGGAGDDTINGGANNDSLIGGDGNDTLSGDDNDDTLYGDAGDDMLNGGNGNDVYVVNDNNGADVFDGGAGSDTINATATQNATIAGLTNIDTITGDSGGTTLHGTDGNDVLDFTSVTFSNISRIDGGAGNDTLTGTNNSDNIFGGTSGVDTLTGGGSADDFILDGSGSVDVITDFNVNDGDIINMTDLVTLPMGGDIEDYVNVQTMGSDSYVSFATTAGGPFTQIAILQGVTGESATSLLSGENLSVTDGS
ncbi:MAG: hypothetical protein CMM48_00455 [Rhodospirillaceae bacterium]|nr:hypothetical protein [Rhodospirillaceae bacterium]HAA92945.1 hypothetical protein [Rhodospirillaceae bacterium]